MDPAGSYKQDNPEVSTVPVVLRRSERLVNKPKVDYRQVALQPRWPIPTAASSDPCPAPTLYPSSTFAALQQHANPSAFETVPATLHSFTPAIYIAPLQVLYHSEALPTTARILYRSFTPKRTGNCR